MPDIIGQLRDAGFSDQEIGTYTTTQRATLKAAGFTDREVDDHFGVPPDPQGVPKAFVDRVSQGSDLSRALSELPKSITDIPHEAMSETAGTFRAAVDNLLPKEFGGAREPEKDGQVEGILKTGMGIADMAAVPFAPLTGAIHSLVGHPLVAALGALREGAVKMYGEDRVRSAEKLAGDTEGGATFEDAKGIVDKAMLTVGSGRIMRASLGVGGAPEIMEIGGLPKGQDFADAANAISNGGSTPMMEQKLADLYEGQGIHPAEAAHDASSDPTVAQQIVSSDRGDMPYGGKPPEPPSPREGREITYGDAEKQILSKISVDEKSPERAMSWDRLYTGFIDKLYPIGKAVKEADLPDLTPENNPYQLARLMSGYAGKADHFLNQGTFDFTTYENNGKSLKSILAPVSADLNGFRAYATASRALELESRGIKSGFNFEGEPSAPPLVSNGLDAARTVVAQGAEKFEKPFRELVDYQNRVSQYLRDSGVLSKAGYDAMVEANKMYVPFSRVMGVDPNAAGVGGSSLQARNPIKAIKGSARDIVDPIESVVRNTYHMVEMAERNQVGTKLIDMLMMPEKALPEGTLHAAAETLSNPGAELGAIKEALEETGLKKVNDLAMALYNGISPDKEGQISVMRNGKRITYNVDPELARSMKGLDAQSASLLEKALSWPASTLRAGAVSTPDFWGRHILRDFIYAATTFKGGVFHPIDMAKGMVGLLMKDEDYWNWLKGGGGNISSVGVDRRYLQEDLRKLTGQTGLMARAWNVLADPEASMWDKAGAAGKLPFQAVSKFALDPLRAATQFAENTSHLAAFKKSMGIQRDTAPANLREQVIRAAWASRDTAVDAARMGANMRAYNMITAFANIKLQDTDRVVRAVKDNPLSALAKIGGMITVPSVVLWAANHDDPRYKEIPQWQKDMFWLVMTPDHVFRIPKPWAAGMVFGTLPERLLDQYVAEKPDAFKDYFHQLWETSGPDFVPSAASPIIDQFANRSTFTNRTLIPSAQEKFLPEYQYTPYTTELAKEVGKVVGAFPGIRDLKTESSAMGGPARALSSPILIENYVRGWSGTLGVYVMNAADAALRKQGILPDPPQPTSTLADIPFIKAFVIRYPSASAESIQTFYDRYQRDKTYFDTWLAKARDGDIAAVEHIQQMGGPTMFARMDAVAKVLGEHQKVIQDIYKNPEVKPDEKRQLLDQLYYSMIQIAHSGNEAMGQIVPARL